MNTSLGEAGIDLNPLRYVGDRGMINDEAKNRKDKARHLAFMLSQLRDDVDELVSGLEFGAIGYETAVAAAKVQLRWMLNQLLSGMEAPPQV
jgi:hypothetical protein